MENTTAKEILDKWHKLDDTLELWVTKKHALKAMEEYHQAKLKNHGDIGDVSRLRLIDFTCYLKNIRGIEVTDDEIETYYIKQ